MPFVSLSLLHTAVEALKGKHPLAVVVLPCMVRSGVRVADRPEDGQPYGSADEVALLNEFFQVPGAPTGRPFRAVWEQDERNYWRDQQYPGRSLQRIRNHRALSRDGFLQAKRPGGKDLWSLTSNCGKKLRDQVGQPVRLIDLAIWYGREWDVDDLATLQTRFLQEFPINQDGLFENIYTDDIPSEYLVVPLSSEPLLAPALLEAIGSRLPQAAGDQLIDDCLISKVDELLKQGYAGVILAGPPGTSKSWYAAQIGAKLADGDSTRVRFVQFHPSYQYEDFVEGYVPNADGGGFELKPKHLMEMCESAAAANGAPCFLVIDELSRSDPARVFGEALTYIETSKRGIQFRLASGTKLSIPPNLYFIATMNEFDRGVEEVDMALERRFARIQMDPDVDYLEEILDRNGMDEDLRARVRRFFLNLQNQREERARLGHAYFVSACNEESLRRLWDHQLQFQLRKAFRLNPDGFTAIGRDWERIFHGRDKASRDMAQDVVDETG